MFRNGLERSARFRGIGRNPRIAPNHYETHYFFNPRRAPRRPRAPPGRRRVEKVVCFVTLWSVPRDSGDSEGILGPLQSVTKLTTFSTLGGLPGGRPRPDPAGEGPAQKVPQGPHEKGKNTTLHSILGSGGTFQHSIEFHKSPKRENTKGILMIWSNF